MPRLHHSKNSAVPQTTVQDRPANPWKDVYIDLSGNISTKSITGAKYFVVFVDSYSAAKHVDFLASKSHFIFAYKSLQIYLGIHPKQIRTDMGREFLSKELSALLEANGTNHVVCARDEYHAVGAAENAIRVLRSNAEAMMLGANVPKRFWPFAISHAAYLNNIVSKSRADSTKTILELLFNRKADVRRIPPFGCYTTIFQDHRKLADQSFGLGSTQGIFIGIARYQKVLGYCTIDVTSSSPEISLPSTRTSPLY